MTVEWASSGYTFSTTSYTGTQNNDAGTGLTLGTTVSPVLAGFLTQIRFWKTSIDTATSRTVGIYNAAGTLLYSQVTSGEPVGTAQWITVTLTTPFATVNAAALVHEYIVAVDYTQQKYPATANVFNAGGGGRSKYSTPAAALYNPGSGEGGGPGNGLYVYGAGFNFPTTTPSSAPWFWIDAGWEVTAAPSGKIKVRSAGGTWDQKPVKYWSGSAWVVKPVKVWTGSAWKTLT